MLREPALHFGDGVTMSSGCRISLARLDGVPSRVSSDPEGSIEGHDSERHEAWLRNQYRHPEEHRHTIAEVQRWFAEHGVEYLRTYPSAVFDETPKDLFTRAADNGGLELHTKIAWMRTLGREGGLSFTIGRKEESPDGDAPASPRHTTPSTIEAIRQQSCATAEAGR